MVRLRQFAIFLVMFALILTVSHFYMFERINYFLQLTPIPRRYTALLFGALPCLILVSLPLMKILPRFAGAVLIWIVYPWMGIAFILFATLVAADILWVILQLIPIGAQPELKLQYDLGITALGVTGVLCGFAIWKGLASVAVKKITVRLSRLPASFEGFRIVQISDVHIGSQINGKWLQKVVDKINALNPDLIVITGDLVDGSVEKLHQQVAPLAQLYARHGTYFVTGNHEYYSGVDAWCRHISQLGITVLRNERVTICSGAAQESFELAGVDDWGSRHFAKGGPDLNKALSGRDPTKVVILLAHQPAAIHEAVQCGVDLQLSGHTHAGQIWPFTYLVSLQQPYSKGLHRTSDSETQIYVSSGTGFWGPPMRLGTDAEITQITLKAGSNSASVERA